MSLPGGAARAALLLLLAPQERAEWWSFRPLAAPPSPPAVEGVAHPVDAFVRARLAERRLAPSPGADRATLIRRLTFDLHGLPPTPEEVRAFVADPAPDSYERLVDRLLASPRYGERQARRWLDQAHYADTHGYDKDKRRPNAWRWRDWVIGALNDDLPWADFLRMQLAGDVLDPGGPGVAATGFLAAGPWDYVGHVELREGTVDKAIARTMDRDDMVQTVFASFASVTVQCARCHDHKFEPIATADYWALQAVFAGIERAERPFDPDPAIAARRRALEAERERVEAERAARSAELERTADPELARLDAALAARAPFVLPAALAAPVAAPDGTPRLGYHSAIEAGPAPEKWVQVDLGASLPVERVALWPAREAFGGHPGPGFGFPPRLTVALSGDPGFADGGVPLLTLARADLPNPGDAPLVLAAGGARARYVRVTAHRLWERTADFALALAEVTVTSEGREISRGAEVTALDSIEAGERWGRARLVDGVVGGTTIARLSAAGDGDPLAPLADAIAAVDASVALALGREALWYTLAGEEALRRLAALDAERARLARELAALPPPARVYAAAREFAPEGSFTPPPGGAPRPVHVLERGDVTRPLDAAAPGTFPLNGLPARFALDEPGDEGARRLALADWLAHPENPLTWRSAVNRVWHRHFGRGIVATLDDFGRMGDAPSHPALLDWLAARFRDGGGSRKDLHRLIVTSATYRQVSVDDPARAAVDAGNHLLWRQRRRRLDAESLRDALLSASGELDLAMGGPGFALFDFEDDHSPRYLYRDRSGEDPATLRRAIYRFAVRSVPDPWLEVFDAPDPSIPTATRLDTTTPQQALALLNDAFVLGRAERLAARAGREAQGLGGAVERAFELACSRPPTSAERAACLDHARARGLAATCRALFASNAFLYVD